MKAIRWIIKKKAFLQTRTLRCILEVQRAVWEASDTPRGAEPWMSRVPVKSRMSYAITA